MASALRGTKPHQGRVLVILALAALQLVAIVPSADAREIFVSDGSSRVLVIDSGSDQVVGQPISVGMGPFGIALRPDGRTAYVTNIDEGLVRAVDTGSKQAVGPPINVGGGPYGIAVTPDGTRVYVANGGAVAVIDTQTNFVGPPITVGNNPRGIAISPDGMTAYVTNQTSGDVSVVDLPSNQAIGAPIVVGGSPLGIAITPNGGRAYVANSKSGSVSVIDTRTNQVVGSPIIVGTEPRAIAISPDGGRAYVANAQSGSVSVIDTGTNQVVGSPIIVGTEPKAIAITPDGARAYVANRESADVTVIDARTNQVVGSPIAAKNAPEAIAITPDQPPIAAFTNAAARPGAAVTFEASGSRDPDGTIARFDWNFGDGQAAPDVGPTPKHTYSRPGTYRATLTLTDNEGCSVSLRFTGQTAYCNGSGSASRTEAVSVAYPAVRVRCPKRAGRSGCRFKLTAVTKRRKGKAMTLTARARAKAGRSTDVSLIPKSRFAAGLATADRVLVREKLTINGSVESLLRRLPILPPPG